MPEVSVIIPVYNAQETIQETINSVLNQSFTDFELIIINAGSTDRTLSIIREFTDTRVQIFNYEPANVAVNRNRGLNHAQGKYITFLDADDLWTSDKLADQVQTLIENPDAALVYSWTDCIDEQGKIIRHCSYPRWNGDVYPQLLLDDFIGSGSNVMMRREAFISVGGFDESLTNAQDTDMWIRLAQLYQFAVVTKSQIRYRIRSNSMSSNILGLEKSNLKVIERAFSHSKAQSYQHLKRDSLGNLYKYLSYKSLDVLPGQQKNWHIIRFLFNTIYYDVSMLIKPIIYKAIFKLIIMAILPGNLAQNILVKYPKLGNTSTFLGYEKLPVIPI